MFLIQLHHCFVQFLTIALELCLQATHLWLQPLHLQHAFGALQREWGNEQHHDDGHQPNGDCIVVGPGVERGNEASGEFKHDGLAIFRVIGATDGRRYRS